MDHWQETQVSFQYSDPLFVVLTMAGQDWLVGDREQYDHPSTGRKDPGPSSPSPMISAVPSSLIGITSPCVLPTCGLCL